MKNNFLKRLELNLVLIFAGYLQYIFAITLVGNEGKILGIILGCSLVLLLLDY